MLQHRHGEQTVHWQLILSMLVANAAQSGFLRSTAMQLCP